MKNKIIKLELSDSDTEPSENDGEQADDESNHIYYRVVKADDDIEIKYVYHISDIHIRIIDRHDEYLEVFNKLYQKIETDIEKHKKESLIVLTGDIVHNRITMSPELYRITGNFLIALTSILPVIVIAGNHDCVANNKDREDALSSLIDRIDPTKIHYFKKTGIYRYNNILFGVTSILDKYELLINEDELNEKFAMIQQKHKYRIALYHGTVAGATNDKGLEWESKNFRPIDFAPYDYVMLGDIHKHQYLDDKKKIGYAGSLIQQNHGETIDKHGYLRWNLFTGQSELVEIENDYGYCTVNIIDGVMEKTFIPKKARIRFVLDNTDEMQYNNVVEKIKKNHIIIDQIKAAPDQTKNNEAVIYDLNEIDGASNRSIIETYLLNYLKQKKISQKEIDKICQIHKDIHDQVRMNIDVIAQPDQQWKILELKFSNLLSYGEGNVIDFRKYPRHKIIGVLAPNHYGKSAIIDIIIYCLFNTYPRAVKRVISKIANVNKNHFSCSILLQQGNTCYFIQRDGKRKKNPVKKISKVKKNNSSKTQTNKSFNKNANNNSDSTFIVKPTFYEFKVDNIGNEIKNTRKNLAGTQLETDSRIKNLVGDYNIFLSTCICLQESAKKNDFTDMTVGAKKDFLTTILKLDVIGKCFEKIKENLKKMKTKKIRLKGESVGTYVPNIEELIDQETKKLAKIKKEITDKQTVATYLDDTIKEGQPVLKEYNELKKYNIKTGQDINDAIKKLENKIQATDKYNIIRLERALKKKTKEFENITEHIRTLRDKCILLQTKINPVPEEFHQLDMNKLYSDLSDLEICLKKLNIPKDASDQKIQSRINKYKNEIENINLSIVSVPDINYLARQNELLEKQKKLRDQLIKYPDNISKEKRNILSRELELKKEFKFEVDEDISEILYCLEQDLPKNVRNMLSEMLIKKQTIVDNLKTNIINIQSVLEIAEDWDPEKVSVELTKIQLAINENMECQLHINSNNIARKKINELKKTLKNLEEMRDNIKQKVVIDNQIYGLKEKISISTKYVKLNKANMKLNITITDLNTDIAELSRKQSACQAEIDAFTDTIANYVREINEMNLYKKHIQLLLEYEIDLTNWSCRNERYMSAVKQKENIMEEITKLEILENQISYELDAHIKTKDEYDSIREKIDQLETNINLCETYKDAMDNTSGIPYTILKEQLPQLENKVNKILADITKFQIKFVYNETDDIPDVKSDLGRVDLDILYPNFKPYNVLLASGFEKFVINISLRIVLGQMSVLSKPNFFIVDEGWSCMDSDNLNNVGTVLNYIRAQYDHVIIISHIDMLKNLMDVSISIDKYAGDSYIDDARQRAIDSHISLSRTADKNKPIEI